MIMKLVCVIIYRKTKIDMHNCTSGYVSGHCKAYRKTEIDMHKLHQRIYVRAL